MDKGDLSYCINDTTTIKVTDLKNGLIFIKTSTYPGGDFYKDPKIQEIVIDTENECVVIGNTAKILLKVYEERKKNE